MRAFGRSRVLPQSLAVDISFALVPPAPEDVFDRWRTLVASTEALYCEIPEVIEGTWAVMAAHDLDAARAASVSLAKVTQAEGLVTTDPAFAAVATTTLPIFVPGRVAGAIAHEQTSRASGAARD